MTSGAPACSMQTPDGRAAIASSWAASPAAERASLEPGAAEIAQPARRPAPPLLKLWPACPEPAALLHWLLAERGDLDGLRALAGAGDRTAAAQLPRLLADLLIKQGRDEEAERLSHTCSLLRITVLRLCARLTLLRAQRSTGTHAAAVLATHRENDGRVLGTDSEPRRTGFRTSYWPRAGSRDPAKSHLYSLKQL